MPTKCLYCGGPLPLTPEIWVKGYVPDLTKWSCYNTVTGTSCRDKKK